MVANSQDADWDDVSHVISSQYRKTVLKQLVVGPATPSQIDNETGVSISHVSRALGELRERELVELLVSEDRRKGRVYGITDQGADLWGMVKTMDDGENEGKDLMTDGGVDGAIDNDWDESELSTEGAMVAAVEDLDHELSAGSVAIDLVTRQPLYLHEQVADDLAEYKEENDFDLFSYKSHPYLPVRLDDRVFECVFVTHEPSQAHNSGKTYDYPEGRLMKIPLSEAWADE